MAKGKGSAFEREICKQMSLWWTHNSADDIFWRSTTSGARATQRAKSGKRTSGQYGDITHIHPCGAKLMDAICFECKRGYPKASLHDALDFGGTHGEQLWVKQILQARDSWEKSGSYSWALISRRDQRRAMIFIPRHLYQELKAQGGFKGGFFAGITMNFTTASGLNLSVFGCGWETFLTEVSPKMIQAIVK